MLTDEREVLRFNRNDVRPSIERLYCVALFGNDLACMHMYVAPKSLALV